MATHQAIWKDTVIAESDDTVVVEGNHYFPADAVEHEYLQPSNKHTRCFWKGTASYYDVVVDGQRTATPPGTTPIPRLRHGRSRATSPSGAA